MISMLPPYVRDLLPSLPTEYPAVATALLMTCDDLEASALLAAIAFAFDREDATRIPSEDTPPPLLRFAISLGASVGLDRADCELPCAPEPGDDTRWLRVIALAERLEV